MQNSLTKYTFFLEKRKYIKRKTRCVQYKLWGNFNNKTSPHRYSKKRQKKTVHVILEEEKDGVSCVCGGIVYENV